MDREGPFTTNEQSARSTQAYNHSSAKNPSHLNSHNLPQADTWAVQHGTPPCRRHTRPQPQYNPLSDCRPIPQHISSPAFAAGTLGSTYNGGRTLVAADATLGLADGTPVNQLRAVRAVETALDRPSASPLFLSQRGGLSVRPGEGISSLSCRQHGIRACRRHIRPLPLYNPRVEDRPVPSISHPSSQPVLMINAQQGEDTGVVQRDTRACRHHSHPSPLYNPHVEDRATTQDDQHHSPPPSQRRTYHRIRTLGLQSSRPTDQHNKRSKSLHGDTSKM
ncbi:hypothetical protein CDD80_7456 [Ophiocordyceps camponoti-rufipedis]|uniref:Uncharacterized protein n=1 Tax=Ophiocordyceps camponoti-rufipedis TaxID=2004952 RepID=A0A2C5ZFS1_9HYPO|nr:hypothetical protein CDD80_7456 [Ophiocordyceps camponoti-rufipedis]